MTQTAQTLSPQQVDEAYFAEQISARLSSMRHALRSNPGADLRFNASYYLLIRAEAVRAGYGPLVKAKETMHGFTLSKLEDMSK